MSKSKRISDQGLRFIQKYEALKLEAYKPTPNDVWTIGYGTTRIDGRPVQRGEVISERQARDYFRADILKFESAVNDLVEVDLTQNQFDALVSFVYNVGIGALSKSTLLKKLNKGDYAGASREFKKWNKQAGKVLNGLTKRRNAEADVFGYIDAQDEIDILEEFNKLKSEELILCQSEDQTK